MNPGVIVACCASMTRVRGVATFLTLSYILFVNPAILSAAGMPFHAVAVATAIAACVTTLAMGLFTNLPFALAPGLGTAPRTPGREKIGGTAEQGYLHCGPAGSGHFVKMVHNGVEYGLSASIYTQDINRAFTAMRDLYTGIFYVNAPTIGAEVHLPFGGTKNTGNGHREAGTAALDVFSEWKSVYVDFSGRLQRAQIDLEEI